MRNYDYKKNTREISVPNDLKNKIKNIFVSKIYYDANINDIIAEFLIRDRGILLALGKNLMTWTDWRQLKISCLQANTKTFSNNGILMEFLSHYILPNVFNLHSLLCFEIPSYEAPESGNDLIFFDSNCDLFIFEVKSKVSNDFSKNELKNKIKNAFTSLFCSKEIKNAKKIKIARDSVEEGLDLTEEEKEKIFYQLDKIELSEGNIIDLVDDEYIKFNICVIGNGFDVDDESLIYELPSLINTTVYCKSDCCYKDKDNHICMINQLEKMMVLNIVNIEFNRELDLVSLNDKIVNLINLEGLDKRC
ncbi:MAG: hypothetical protein HFJ02_05400 [Bacilli bacterium]|nr:hypothetical protein [Bacilli bacterium]